jgi:hypothetical protein
LAYSFRGFDPSQGEGRAWCTEKLTSWLLGSREKGIQEEVRARCSSKDMPPVTYFSN